MIDQCYFVRGTGLYQFFEGAVARLRPCEHRANGCSIAPQFCSGAGGLQRSVVVEAGCRWRVAPYQSQSKLQYYFPLAQRLSGGSVEAYGRGARRATLGVHCHPQPRTGANLMTCSLQAKKAVPGTPLTALEALPDANTREVLRALVDVHHVRNGYRGKGDGRFITALEAGLAPGYASLAAQLAAQNGAGLAGNGGKRGTNGGIHRLDLARILNDL